MPHAGKVRRGDGFLPGVSLQDLQEMWDGERDPKARTILQAAIHRKTGLLRVLPPQHPRTLLAHYAAAFGGGSQGGA